MLPGLRWLVLGGQSLILLVSFPRQSFFCDDLFPLLVILKHVIFKDSADTDSAPGEQVGCVFNGTLQSLHPAWSCFETIDFDLELRKAWKMLDPQVCQKVRRQSLGSIQDGDNGVLA